MTVTGSPYDCSKCGEARGEVYTCRDGGESVRVCPHDRDEKGCWWVVSGNPHSDGYGCICFIDPKHHTRP